MAAKSYRRYKKWRNAANKTDRKRREICAHLGCTGRVKEAIAHFEKHWHRQNRQLNRMLNARDALTRNGLWQKVQKFGGL